MKNLVQKSILSLLPFIFYVLFYFLDLLERSLKARRALSFESTPYIWFKVAEAVPLIALFSFGLWALLNFHRVYRFLFVIYFFIGLSLLGVYLLNLFFRFIPTSSLWLSTERALIISAFFATVGFMGLVYRVKA